MSIFEHKASDYLACGIATFAEEDGFLCATQWDLLERTIASMTYSPVVLGDAGEINHLDVARFLTDVQDVKVADEPATEVLKGVIGAGSLEAFHRRITGFERVVIRRAQVNRMKAGSFIGEHVDRESNPAYAAAVVLQFGRDFSGGGFVVRDGDGVEREIMPTYRSVVVTRCDLPHRVERVTAGERTSLVYFLADHDGPNARYSS